MTSPADPTTAEAMQDDARLLVPQVGEMQDGTVIRAQVFPPASQFGYASDDLLCLRLLSLPARGDRGERWALGWVHYKNSVVGMGETRASHVFTAWCRFDDFCALVLDNADLTDPARDFIGGNGSKWLFGARMLQELLVASYDTGDEVEVNERMLVALGATPEVLPRRLMP